MVFAVAVVLVAGPEDIVCKDLKGGLMVLAGLVGQLAETQRPKVFDDVDREKRQDMEVDLFVVQWDRDTAVTIEDLQLMSL